MKKLILLFLLSYTVFAKEITNFEVYKKLPNDFAKKRFMAEMLDDELPTTRFQSEIVDLAIGLLGIKYRFGGETINGMDCSSFVQKVYKMAGANLPRTARYQAEFGIFVSREDLKPGDLLFFQTYAKFPSHVGIYVGEGKMIHASSAGKRIIISDINKDYYLRHFLYAKRIYLYDPKIALNKEETDGKN
ncbi:MAG: NlpC/P60 family protein [Aquificota bacterium]|nr:MAG: NlpC/P60 family protein [Aquificota bacterium]